MTNTIEPEFRFTMVPEWLLDSDVSGDAILLYVALGRYADSQTHEAYPSRKTLADRCRMSPTSVDRASAELVKAGAITKRQRQNNSLVYTLHLSPRVKTPVTTGGDSLSPPAVIAVTTGGDLTITTERKPVEREPLKDIAPKQSSYDSNFEDWWACYPRKRGKGVSAKAYKKAIGKIAHDSLMQRTIVFANDPNRVQRFTPYPERWLNEERWDDEPETAHVEKLTNNQKNLLMVQRAEAEEQKAIGDAHDEA